MRPVNSLGHTVRLSTKGDDAQVHIVTPLPLSPKGIRVRESTRWYDCPPCIKGNWGIPYINDVGKFTGHVAYTWNCDPRSYIATVVATISRRLEVYARRHNRYHEVKSNLNRIIRVSYYYAVSKNDYLMDRILYFLRNLKKRGMLIHRFLLVHMSKCDENFRFVYSHVCSQTKWLLFRAFRPRDKSHATRVFDDSLNAKFKDPYMRYEAVWTIAQAMRPTLSLSTVQWIQSKR